MESAVWSRFLSEPRTTVGLVRSRGGLQRLQSMLFYLFLLFIFISNPSASQSVWSRVNFEAGQRLPINSTFGAGAAFDESGALWLFGGTQIQNSFFKDDPHDEMWMLKKDSEDWEFIGSGESHPDGSDWPPAAMSPSVFILQGSLFLIDPKSKLWEFNMETRLFKKLNFEPFLSPAAFQQPIAINGSLWGIVPTGDNSNSIITLWQFEARNQRWVNHGRIPVGSDSISDGTGTSTVVPRFALLADTIRGYPIVLERGDGTSFEFFVAYNPSGRSWSRVSFSGRIPGPISAITGATSIGALQSHLQFMLSKEDAAPWPNATGYIPSQIKIVDMKRMRIARLPQFPIQLGAFSGVFSFVASQDARTLVAIGGQADKDFQMWIYNVTACPSDCGAPAGNGICVDDAYCECSSSRYGDEMNCASDCGEAGCGAGFCAPTAAGPKCQCPLGFIGDRCEIPFRCENWGKLYNNKGNATCVCSRSPSFKGDRCQFPACPNCELGKCVNGLCECWANVTGALCDVQLSAPEVPVLNCSETITSAPASWSWCFKRNALLAPVRLPVANTSIDDPLLKEPSCVNDDIPPNSNCKAIYSLETVGSIVVKSYSSDNVDYSTQSLILVGLSSGEFGAVSFTDEQIAGRWRLRDSPILAMKAQVCVTTRDKAGILIAAADKKGFGLYFVTSNRTDDEFRTTWMIESNHIDSPNQIEFLDMVIDVEQQDKTFFITVWALLLDTITGDRFLQARVIGLDMSPSKPVSKFIDWSTERGVTWNFASQQISSENMPLSITSISQGLGKSRLSYAQVTDPGCSSNSKRRDLMAMRSLRSVYFFALPDPSNLLSFDIRTVVPINPTDPGVLRWTIQGADNLVDISVFSECWRRSADNSASLWMLAAVSSSSQLSGRLVAVKFSEFSLHSPGCGQPFAPSRLLSIPIDVNPKWPCDPQKQWPQQANCDLSQQYWNGTDCVTRLTYSWELDFVPTQMTRRSIGKPVGLTNPNQLKNFVASTNETISSLLESFLYSSIYVRDSQHRVHVLGVQEDLRMVNNISTLPLPLRLVPLSVFYSAGNIEAMSVTDNGEHFFVATSGEKWEIDAQKRLVDICAEREASETSKKILSSYEPLCNPPSGFKPAQPSVASFVFFGSMCTSGIHCPAFVGFGGDDVIGAEAPKPGTYALFPGRLRNCSRGNFCAAGKNQPCPIGFKCPYDHMSLPIRCEPNEYRNTTCFQTGLADEMPCPDGFVCTGMDVPPIPAPAGYYLPNNTNFRKGPGARCPEGDYCPLAASDPPPLCPEGFFCTNASVILPQVCPTMYDSKGNQIHNDTSYCPAGSSNATLCPEGFVCETPWRLKRCSKGEYCPAGSQIAKDCPSGRLCQDPGSNVPCPAGYYCPGSTWNAIRCSPLSLCAEGSATERRWMALLIESIAIIVVAVGGKLLAMWNERRWRRRAERRQAKRMGAINRYAPVPSFMADSEVEEDELSLLGPGSSSHSSKSNLQSMNLGLSVEFRNLQLTVGSKKKQKVILEGVSGGFEPGTLTAVMGPSGAGKTSLISVLSGQAPKTGGEIFVNGQRVLDLTDFNSVMGFVPQEDIMHRTLTVKEILNFNAATRLDISVSPAEREDLVDDIIDILGLKKVQDSIIGDETKRGLSGGERKRVNVGMELAADPSILFLDEPTSGLDSTSAVQVIQCLKTIASRSNMTIVCVIHQPRQEVFNLFDSVLFLQPGGRTVFQGSLKDANEYFGKNLDNAVPNNGVNPADWYMDVISDAVSRGDDLSLAWSQHDADRSNDDNSINSSQSSSPFRPRNRAGFLKQLWLVYIRSLLLQFRDLSAYLVNIFLIFVAGLLLGFIYSGSTFTGPASSDKQAACPDFIKELCALPIHDDYVGQFALLVLSLGLTAVAGALNTFGSERLTFWRESRTAGLSSLAFFIAKNLAAIPMIVLPPLFLLSIFYFLTAPAASFWMMFAILLCVQFACTAAGYVISLLVAPHTALLAGVVYTVICTLISGANPSLKKLNNYGVIAQIASSISFCRWAIEALYCSVLIEFRGSDDIKSALEFWGYSMSNYPRIDIVCLLAIGLALRVIAYLVLYFMHSRRKQ